MWNNEWMTTNFKLTSITIWTSLTMLAGTVNIGIGTFLTYPSFLIGFLILIYWRKKDKYIIGITFILCLLLYATNDPKNKIFYPLVGKQIASIAGDCLYDFNQPMTIGKCIVGYKPYAGEKFKVENVMIDENFLNSKYYMAWISSKSGSKHQIFVKDEIGREEFSLDGEALKRKDMENQFFYYLSFLIYWPFSLVSQIWYCVFMIRASKEEFPEQPFIK